MEKREEMNFGSEESLEEIFTEIEIDKEKKMLNLIVDIIVKATLKEYYETSD